ncbi:hypothetical protein SAMN02745866_00141 [Alteromonadaceae bacterium Bs31]|nr:hypothetical protein SAMN02745866_00141 [Alteromonadaceae bacterium Bs31]
MKRYYYLSNDLYDLERAASDLHEAGVSDLQIHVLSQQDAELEKRHLHEVHPFAKRALFQAGILGAAIGLVLAAMALMLGVAFAASSAVDWLPFGVLAFVLFAFSTWEGGFYGIQVSSKEYLRFKEMLSSGHHVLMVDVDRESRDRVQHVLAYHQGLIEAGEGVARPGWLIASQKNLQAFVKAMP